MLFRKSPYKKPKRHRSPLFFLVIIITIAAGIFAYMYHDLWYGDLAVTEATINYPAVTPTATITPTPSVVPEQASVIEEVTVPTWPVELTPEQTSSVTVVVNKKHKLPNDYVPAGLTPIDGGYLKLAAADAMQILISDGALNGFSFTLVSDYRSYSDQEAVYYGYVNRDGQALADTYSARPGFSEHQTGLAADVAEINTGCALMTCFGTTPAGQWIASNSYKYGFIIRYPEGKDATTGYQYEPWHLRYIGISAALGVYNSGLTMDEYFGITAGDYQ
jgi:D-alanyl-D-alanine carboxypeptidase